MVNGIITRFCPKCDSTGYLGKGELYCCSFCYNKFKAEDESFFPDSTSYGSGSIVGYINHLGERLIGGER